METLGNLFSTLFGISGPRLGTRCPSMIIAYQGQAWMVTSSITRLDSGNSEPREILEINIYPFSGMRPYIPLGTDFQTRSRQENGVVVPGEEISQWIYAQDNVATIKKPTTSPLVWVQVGRIGAFTNVEIMEFVSFHANSIPGPGTSGRGGQIEYDEGFGSQGDWEWVDEARQ